MWGKCITLKETERIKYLLASTEVTMAEIAARMGRSKSVVIDINRRHKIRDYQGQRLSFTKGETK